MAYIPISALKLLCQFGCLLACGGSSTPTYDVNKIQVNLKSKKKRRERTKTYSRAEHPLPKQMRFERRPEKTCLKGKEIWVGTNLQAPSDLKPILQRLYKNVIRTADLTRLDAWYLKRKELNKEKH